MMGLVALQIQILKWFSYQTVNRPVTEEGTGNNAKNGELATTDSYVVLCCVLRNRECL